MEVPLLSSAIIFFTVAVVMCSSSSLPAQEYWNQVLPNTPMPQAIKDSLDPNSDVSIGVGIGKGGAQVHISGPKSGTGVSVGKGGVQVHVSTPKSGTGVSVGKGGAKVHVSTPKSGTGVSVGKGGAKVHVSTPKSGTGVSVGKGGAKVHISTPNPGTGVSVSKGEDPVHVSEAGAQVHVSKGGVHAHVSNPKSGTGVSVSKGGAQVNVSTPKSKTGVSVGKGGATVHVNRPKGKGAYVSVKPGPKGFLYKYAATETQLHDDPNTALFFREKDLTTPTKNTMNLRFTTGSSTTFLPRNVADSVPFSSKRLPDILDRLNIVPGSTEAVAVESTVKECEEKAVKGEDKRCVDSLEEMVDYATSKLGTRVSVVSTDSGDNKVKKYKVVKATRLGHGKANHAVVCHKQSYPYAVFYCHYTKTTRVYEVSLEAGPETKVKAVAVCHTDTSEWNPKHLAFMVLKVKPGTVPVCHFLPQDHVVWVPK